MACCKVAMTDALGVGHSRCDTCITPCPLRIPQSSLERSSKSVQVLSVLLTAIKPRRLSPAAVAAAAKGYSGRHQGAVNWLYTNGAIIWGHLPALSQAGWPPGSFTCHKLFRRGRGYQAQLPTADIFSGS